LTDRLAPAKVNLGLAVTGRRPDGYHELRSVFLRVGLCDGLEARLAPGAAADELRISGDDDCSVEGNIVLRALAALRGWAGADLPPLAFHLDKRIPVAAGLGGGSSDAAAALDLAAGLWGLQLPDDERLRLASELGADVPFFATGHEAALVGGIGDVLLPLPGVSGGAGILLVTPALRLSTATVFAAYDRLQGATAPAAPAVSTSARDVDELAAALAGGVDGAGLASRAVLLREANDLWAAAVVLAPTLGDLRAELERALQRPVLLTGSGSTVFALYASQDEAREAGESLGGTAPTVLAGARIIAGGVDIDQPPWRFP
jgi:4-diphosphocytidyl-2-C-methyl-D-erythritol kinase